MATFDPAQAPTQACQVCGTLFQQGYTHYFDGKQYQTEWLTDTTCDDCEQAALYAPLAAEPRQQLEELIYQRHILEGILLLKRSLGIGLKEATALHHWCYKQLRAAQSQRFNCSDEAYWRGFYS